MTATVQIEIPTTWWAAYTQEQTTLDAEYPGTDSHLLATRRILDATPTSTAKRYRRIEIDTDTAWHLRGQAIELCTIWRERAATETKPHMRGGWKVRSVASFKFAYRIRTAIETQTAGE